MVMCNTHPHVIWRKSSSPVAFDRQLTCHLRVCVVRKGIASLPSERDESSADDARIWSFVKPIRDIPLHIPVLSANSTADSLEIRLRITLLMKRNTIRIWRHGCTSCLLQLIPLIWIFFPQGAYPASLEPCTASAWDGYIESATMQMNRRLIPGKTFLWIDEAPKRLARVRAGEIVVSPVGPHDPVKVPSGLIHDWIGAVFIPHATLNDFLQTVRDYSRYNELYRPSVMDSKAITTSESQDRFSLVLASKSFFLKTALATEYESHYLQVGARNGYAIARTTRIQEIENYQDPGQRTLPEGYGIGVIWRLVDISRYAERDGGVYFELEAIGLSRDVPPTLRWLVEPIIRRVSQECLSTCLRQTENAVRYHAELASGRSIATTSRPVSSAEKIEWLLEGSRRRQ